MNNDTYYCHKIQIEKSNKGLVFQRAKYLRQALKNEPAQTLRNTQSWIRYYQESLQRSLDYLAKHHQQDHTLSGSKSK